MRKKMVMIIPLALLLGGCAGANIHLGASNTPSQCAEHEALGKVPQAQQYNYVQRCSAGYRASEAAQPPPMQLDLPASASSSG